MKRKQRTWTDPRGGTLRKISKHNHATVKKVEKPQVEKLEVITSQVPNRSHVFLPIIQQLRDMHNAKVCHGDIRLANFVFCHTSAKDSKLLDADQISGRRRSKKYPSHYNTNALDARRHPKAVPGATLHYTHDWFSLSAVMKFFEPKKDRFKDIWEEIIEAVRSKATETETIDKLSLRFKLQLKEEFKESLGHFATTDASIVPDITFKAKEPKPMPKKLTKQEKLQRKWLERQKKIEEKPKPKKARTTPQKPKVATWKSLE